MKQMLYPICCAHMLSQSGGKLVFRALSGKLYTFKSNAALILAVLRRSTGTAPADAIARAVSGETGIPADTVMDAVDDLVACGILVDSHEQLSAYHVLTYNPPRYPPPLSFCEADELTASRPDYCAKAPIAVYKDQKALSLPLYRSLAERHSCRAFRHVPVESEKLFALCRVSYSSRLRPVASAGGLFPLSVYIINRLSSPDLPAGLYQYDPEQETLLLLAADPSYEAVCYALGDGEAIFGAPCIFFICGDIGRHVKKYANRGYRYTLLEAGHAVQNMTLAAAELGLGGVEYGGFCDEAVNRLFRLPEALFPLACYAAGYEDAGGERLESLRQREQERRSLEEIAHGGKLSLNLYLVEDERFRSSNLCVVVSQFTDAAGRAEFGTGAAAAYRDAYAKSVMEAYERYALSRRYSDLTEQADRLDGPYLNAEEYAPYSNAQRQAAGFAKFRTDTPIEWLRGHDLAGHPVYIPADLCFDVAGPGHTPIHIANTSGCAANFDTVPAERAALLELIERDAVVKTWLYQKTPWRLDEKTLPDRVRQRFRRYREQGLNLSILSLPCEFAYTVLVCSMGTVAPPYFAAGASASFDSAVDAAVKAFNEWELSFVLGGTQTPPDVVEPEHVISPKDHGNIYRWSNHNDEVEYLLRGPQISIHDVQADRLGELCALSPVFLTYRPVVNHAYVVRAFSKELVPINFGYNMDFFSHRKIDRRLLKDRKFPHFFA